MRKNFTPILPIAFILCAVVILTSFSFAQPLQRPTVPPDFKGRYLLALSDADMVASAYIDSILGPVVGKDELTIIPFTATKTTTSVSTLPVTNSVTGPPASIAVSPDGKYAIVIETRGPRPPNKPAALMPELAKGYVISVVDVSQPAQPRIVQVLQGGERPVSVCFNAAGNRVAVVYTSFGGKQPSLVLYKFSNGRLLSPVVSFIPGWQAGDDLVDGSFYGKENVLALLNIGNATLAFLSNDGFRFFY